MEKIMKHMMAVTILIMIPVRKPDESDESLREMRERGERETDRGVRWQEIAIIYIYMYICIAR